MKASKRIALLLFCLSCMVLLLAPPSRAMDQTSCEVTLKTYVQNLHDTTFHKPVTKVTATWHPASDGTPEYCQVTGWIWPEIEFQVSLPTDWNRRYINSGGGGWDGSLVGPIAEALAKGYATSGANGGYMAANWPADSGSFGLKEPFFSMYYPDYPKVDGGFYGDLSPEGQGNPYACQKVIDFGIRHLKETPLIAKRIIKQYYGKDIKYSYFSGASCGGKEGQISAQKLYDIYDGFYINCPLGGHQVVALRGTWDTAQGKLGGLSDFVIPGCTNWMFCPNVYSMYKTQAHRDAVYKKCDGVDGLVDGLIDDPRTCNFDAMEDLPACTDENDIYSTTCFTTAQRKSLKEIYAGPHDSHGKPWYVGQPLSAEAIGPGMFGGVSSLFGFALNDGMAPGMYGNIALNPPQGPDFDILAFDWDKDPRRAQRATCTQCYDNGRCETVRITDVLDGITTSPDPAPNMGGFEPLYRKGGKIIQAHGWADSLVSALGGSTQFYETILKQVGVERTKSFYKLYMVPGASHCGGGIGYYPSWGDMFDALVAWVEKDKEPDSFIGTRLANTDPNWPELRTRPVCPYPEVARYKGRGSIEDAGSFMCVPPITVNIEPGVVSLRSRGTLTAAISVPKGYRIRDWHIGDLTCNGAPIVKGTYADNGYVARFSVRDLVDVSPGAAVELVVKGTFRGSVEVQATDTVRVTR